LGKSKGLIIAGMCVLAIGMLIGILGYSMLNSERINWWNAQMDLKHDQAVNDEYQVSVDQYNIILAESNIWEAQGRMMAGAMTMVLALGIMTAGLAFKK